MELWMIEWNSFLFFSFSVPNSISFHVIFECVRNETENISRIFMNFLLLVNFLRFIWEDKLRGWTVSSTIFLAKTLFFLNSWNFSETVWWKVITFKCQCVESQSVFVRWLSSVIRDFEPCRQKSSFHFSHWKTPVWSFAVDASRIY